MTKDEDRDSEDMTDRELIEHVAASENPASGLARNVLETDSIDQLVE